jgi:hypothetical protein
MTSLPQPATAACAQNLKPKLLKHNRSGRGRYGAWGGCELCSMRVLHVRSGPNASISRCPLHVRLPSITDIARMGRHGSLCHEIAGMGMAHPPTSSVEIAAELILQVVKS